MDSKQMTIGGIVINLKDAQARADISTINGKIPNAAAPNNQLADKDFVNSSIATATATHRGTFNLVSDLSLTVAATQAQIATALGTAVSTADDNDYAFVQIPTADATPTEIARVERYKYNGTAWAFEYGLNNSGFTSAQWAALNSGITSGLVSKLNALPTNSELTTLLNGKQSTITDLDSIRSGASAGATAVQPAAIANMEENTNKVTSIGSGSTDTQYPSAKAVYDANQDLIAKLGTTQSVYTLEQNSSPIISISNKAAVENYVGYMGGYLLLVKDGKVYAAKLNPSNWGFFEDGAAVTAAARAATETMIKTPQANFKVNGKTVSFGGLTPVKDGKSFKAPTFVGAYQMDNNGHSRPGVGSGHSKTMSAFWSLAQAIGSEFGLANYQFHCLINVLYQAMYGNLNSESFLSNGNSRSSASWDAYRDLAHGKADALGDGTGCVSAVDSADVTRYVTKLFGFEDLFGKLWEFRPGIRFFMDGDVRKAIIYNGNLVSNTVAEGDAAFDHMLTGVLASAGGQYTTAMELGEYCDMLPKAVGGGDTTYYCDGYWASTGGELLIVGGSAIDGSLCGLSSAGSNYAFGRSYDGLGARLAFYGEPEIVSGTELLALLA